MEPTQKNSNTGKIIGVLAVVAVGAVTVFAAKNSSTPAAPADATTTGGTDASTTTPATVASTPAKTTTPVVTPVTVKTAPAASTSVYKDGTYSATGSYFSPGGPDKLGVTLTLANDVVTSVSVTPEAGDGTSARYQQRFISGYKTYVVGQNIASIHLTRVSGSSLTPIGFDDALAQIKAEAKA